jgi:preprotein translocase subunit SecF
MIHDILVVTGVFAVFNMEVNSAFVAIILTVVGYSVNDTIVIYDRIRENMNVKRHLPFDRLVNVSLVETLTRSINTGLCTILAIVALLIFGGASIRTFMIGIAVGIFTGTYSSIFIASMLVVSWRSRGKGTIIIEEKPKPVMASAGPIRVGYAERPEEEGEEEGEAGQVDMIQVGQGSPKPKTGKRPKRRRRR